ncbi:MAG: hypothetical protein OXC40_01425, partial [Proteobacteria bacterium]|nr:hypothetical protein [Pseudomonadota bacterium]
MTAKGLILCLSGSLILFSGFQEPIFGEESGGTTISYQTGDKQVINLDTHSGPLPSGNIKLYFDSVIKNNDGSQGIDLVLVVDNSNDYFHEKWDYFGFTKIGGDWFSDAATGLCVDDFNHINCVAESFSSLLVLANLIDPSKEIKDNLGNFSRRDKVFRNDDTLRHIVKDYFWRGKGGKERRNTEARFTEQVKTV